MTAFDNIKVNNWPATSNDLEDFLVLELPLNDAASLTESRRDIIAGSTVLYPKRTLTNNGVGAQPATPSALGYVANVRLHTYIYNTPGTLTVNGTTVPRGSDPNGNVTFTVAVNGDLNSIAWSYDSGSGPYCYMRGIEVDYGDGNGYQLLTDGATNYSNLVSGTVDSSYPLSNLFGGTIGTGYNNGTRHTNPGTLTLNLAGNKKHYDNSAVLAAGSSNYLQTVDLASVPNTDYTYECYARADGAIGNLSLFHTNQTQRGGILALFTSATNIQLYFGSAGNTWTSNHSIAVNIDDAWHHYAVVRQNGGDVNLYMDGILKGAVTTPGAHTHGELVIGRQGGDNNLYWNGAVQDFRIYRTAKYTTNFTPPGAILG